MIAGLGQNNGAWKKAGTANQTLTAVGFQKTVFAHQASGGETGINLASLTVPPQMSAQGFTNPSTATLLGAQLLFYSRNLTLWSSVHGRMTQKFQYVVSSSAQITFLGFTALPGEIFEGTIDYNALPNVQVVSAVSPAVTGTLPAGTTDFNVGFPFLTNQNSTSQMGAVRVTRNGQLMLRNTGNANAAAVLANTSTGDYQEIDSGSGLGQLIRFNKIDPDNDGAIAVEPTARLAEMPNGSMMAVIETVQGQINTMATYVAALAGVSSTTVTAGAATTVALQTFGSVVLNLQQNAALVNAVNTFTQSNVWGATQTFPAGSLFAGRIDGTVVPPGYIGELLFGQNNSNTPLSSGVAAQICSVPLTPGVWCITGAIYTRIQYSAAPTVWMISGGTSATGGNSFPGDANYPFNYARLEFAPLDTVTGETQMAIPPIYITTSVSMSYFLNTASNWSGGSSVTVSARGGIQAQRVG